MSIFDNDFKEKVLDTFNPDEIMIIINRLGDRDVIGELDNWSTKVFGLVLLDVWKECSNVYEKIELFLYLLDSARDTPYFHNTNTYLIANDAVKQFKNKVLKFIEFSPKEIKNVETKKHGKRKKFFDTEVSATLEVIKDETINSLVHIFFNSSDPKEKEGILFSLQKPLYQKIRKYSAGLYDGINVPNIKRKLEVIIRHGDEANDSVVKPWFDKLSPSEKVKEMDKLMKEVLSLMMMFE